MKILAIETSCDETAAAVVEAEGLFPSEMPASRTKSETGLEWVAESEGITRGLNIKILSNVVSSQIKIHQKFGGVFPEYASRAHSEKILAVVEEALIDDFDLIAVTTGPGLIGSLLVGVNFAKTLAFVADKPIIGINHWLGHIYSNFVGKNPEFPALVLIASGGHTGLVLMKSHQEIQTLGETLDDAAGEAFDKVAKLLGLGYPGGPAISKIASKGNPNKYQFPRSMLDRKDYNFSFSGLKTAVLYESRKYPKLTQQNEADFAASFQQAVIDILIGKTLQAARQFKPKSICLCGGVAANYELRKQIAKAVTNLPYHPSFHSPSFELSTDNAAMIGIAAAYHLDQKTTWDKINTNANSKLKV